MNGRNFFTELKRRNVYKVAVAYALVAGLLIQLASILFPTFEAPVWLMKVFVAVVALGFPLAFYVGVGDLSAGPEWDGLRADPRFQKLAAEMEAAMDAQPSK